MIALALFGYGYGRRNYGYPHYDTDDPRFVLSGHIPDDFKAAVCYENALRVFGPAALRAA